MDKRDFYFDLPNELIAQTPLKSRDNSRLLCVNRDKGELGHSFFHELPGLLRAGDLLVLNDTKVIPARLFGTRESGGTVEVLLLRECAENAKSHEARDCILPMARETRLWECMVRPGKKAGAGTVLTFGGGELTGTVKKVLPDGNRIIDFECKGDFFDVLDTLGNAPLPPYIKNADLQGAEKVHIAGRYQTVYAKNKGSAAAPTAGLHFTDELFDRLRDAGVNTCFITLHVGQGTFLPVKTEKIEDHIMHSEFYSVSGKAADLINSTKAYGGRVIAVGTTSCRTLESVSNDNGSVPACSGETDIFIYPGYKFKCIDGLITNFHLPESTLIMLVSAFAGQKLTMEAYNTAVAEKYRFYSFGDAMLIL